MFWCKTGKDFCPCMAGCPYSHPNHSLHKVIRWGNQTIRIFPLYRSASGWLFLWWKTGTKTIAEKIGIKPTRFWFIRKYLISFTNFNFTHFHARCTHTRMGGIGDMSGLEALWYIMADRWRSRIRSGITVTCGWRSPASGKQTPLRVGWRCQVGIPTSTCYSQQIPEHTPAARHGARESMQFAYLVRHRQFAHCKEVCTLKKC